MDLAGQAGRDIEGGPGEGDRPDVPRAGLVVDLGLPARDPIHLSSRRSARVERAVGADREGGDFLLRKCRRDLCPGSRDAQDLARVSGAQIQRPVPGLHGGEDRGFRDAGHAVEPARKRQGPVSGHRDAARLARREVGSGIGEPDPRLRAVRRGGGQAEPRRRTERDPTRTTRQKSLGRTSSRSWTEPVTGTGCSSDCDSRRTEERSGAPLPPGPRSSSTAFDRRRQPRQRLAAHHRSRRPAIGEEVQGVGRPHARQEVQHLREGTRIGRVERQVIGRRRRAVAHEERQGTRGRVGRHADHQGDPARAAAEVDQVHVDGHGVSGAHLVPVGFDVDHARALQPVGVPDVDVEPVDRQVLKLVGHQVVGQEGQRRHGLLARRQAREHRVPGNHAVRRRDRRTSRRACARRSASRSSSERCRSPSRRGSA